MEFLGKRSDRMRVPKQFGLDPELGAIVRNRADKKRRSLDEQLAYLIEVGVEHDPEFGSNERRRIVMYEAAHDGTPVHAPAQPNIEPHSVARESRPEKRNGTTGRTL